LSNSGTFDYESLARKFGPTSVADRQLHMGAVNRSLFDFDASKIETHENINLRKVKEIGFGLETKGVTHPALRNALDSKVKIGDGSRRLAPLPSSTDVGDC
jgi:hypothetical protein